MPELEIGLGIITIMIVGGTITIFLQHLPRLWRWFKYSVWKDLNYAQGYRRGYADGQRNERRWRDAS